MINVGFWMQVDDVKDGGKFEVRITYNGDVKMSGEINIPNQDHSRLPFVIPPGLIEVKENGELRLDAREDGTRSWKALVKMPVQVIPRPTASPQPS